MDDDDWMFMPEPAAAPAAAATTTAPPPANGYAGGSASIFDDDDNNNNNSNNNNSSSKTSNASVSASANTSYNSNRSTSSLKRGSSKAGNADVDLFSDSLFASEFPPPSSTATSSSPNVSGNSGRSDSGRKGLYKDHGPQKSASQPAHVGSGSSVSSFAPTRSGSNSIFGPPSPSPTTTSATATANTATHGSTHNNSDALFHVSTNGVEHGGFNGGDDGSSSNNGNSSRSHFELGAYGGPAAPAGATTTHASGVGATPSASASDASIFDPLGGGSRDNGLGNSASVGGGDELVLLADEEAEAEDPTTVIARLREAYSDLQRRYEAREIDHAVELGEVRQAAEAAVRRANKAHARTRAEVESLRATDNSGEAEANALAMLEWKRKYQEEARARKKSLKYKERASAAEEKVKLLRSRLRYVTALYNSTVGLEPLDIPAALEALTGIPEEVPTHPDELRRALLIARNRAEDAEERLASQEEVIAEVVEESEMSAMTVRSLRAELAETNTKVAQLKVQLQEASESKAGRSTEKLEASLWDSLRAASTEADKVLAHQRKQLSRFEALRTDALQAARSHAAAIETKGKELYELEKKLAKKEEWLRGAMSSHAAAVRKAKGRSAKRKAQEESDARAIVELTRTTKELRAEVEAAREAAATAEAEAQDAEARASAAESQVVQLKASLEEMASKLDAALTREHEARSAALAAPSAPTLAPTAGATTTGTASATPGTTAAESSTASERGDTVASDATGTTDTVGSGAGDGAGGEAGTKDGGSGSDDDEAAKAEGSRYLLSSVLFSSNVFGRLELADVYDAVNVFTEVNLPAGTTVCETGRDMTTFYVVSSGTLSASPSAVASGAVGDAAAAATTQSGSAGAAAEAGGAEQGSQEGQGSCTSGTISASSGAARTIGSGDWFGQLSTTPVAATETVVAATDVAAWALDRASYTALVESSAQKKRKLYGSWLAGSVPLLAAAPAELVAELAGCACREEFSGGDTVVTQGSTAASPLFYLVFDGCVTVSKSAAVESVAAGGTDATPSSSTTTAGAGGTAASDGGTGEAATTTVSGSMEPVELADFEPQELVSYEAGDYFGEVALVNGGPRAATVVVTSPQASVLTFDAEGFALIASACAGALTERAGSYVPPVTLDFRGFAERTAASVPSSLAVEPVSDSPSAAVEVPVEVPVEEGSPGEGGVTSEAGASSKGAADAAEATSKAVAESASTGEAAAAPATPPPPEMSDGGAVNTVTTDADETADRASVSSRGSKSRPTSSRSRRSRGGEGSRRGSGSVAGTPDRPESGLTAPRSPASSAGGSRASMNPSTPLGDIPRARAESPKSDIGSVRSFSALPPIGGGGGSSGARRRGSGDSVPSSPKPAGDTSTAVVGGDGDTGGTGGTGGGEARAPAANNISSKSGVSVNSAASGTSNYATGSSGPVVDGTNDGDLEVVRLDTWEAEQVTGGKGTTASSTRARNNTGPSCSGGGASGAAATATGGGVGNSEQSSSSKPDGGGGDSTDTKTDANAKSNANTSTSASVSAEVESPPVKLRGSTSRSSVGTNQTPPTASRSIAGTKTDSGSQKGSGEPKKRVTTAQQAELNGLRSMGLGH